MAETIDIEKQLIDTIELMDKQIAHIYEVYSESRTLYVVDPVLLQTPDGNYVLIPLLTAKAQALAALVQFRDMRSRIVADQNRFFGGLPQENHD